MARNPDCCVKAPSLLGTSSPPCTVDAVTGPQHGTLRSPMSPLSSGRPPAEGPVQRPLLHVLGLWEGET